MSEPLKLRGRDARDLEMISACVQDALVPLAEIRYLPRERRFALMLNRFRWEGAPEASPAAGEHGDASIAAGDAGFADQARAVFERTHAVLTFDRVRGVKRRGLEQALRAGILSLLSVAAQGRHVVIAFAGGGAIRLEVDQIACRLQDIGEPWPTVWQPRHAGQSPGSEPTDGAA
jgi:Protein of unknown function (DUF2948)